MVAHDRLANKHMIIPPGHQTTLDMELGLQSIAAPVLHIYWSVTVWLSFDAIPPFPKAPKYPEKDPMQYFQNMSVNVHSDFSGMNIL